MLIEMTKEFVARYSRQLIMPEIGVEGQQKVQRSKVLIVGAGGLGCPVAQYLVAGGVGTVGIVDYDLVEVSNLPRQILHTEEAAMGEVKKVSSAACALRKLNSSCNVIPISVKLDRWNAMDIFKGYDIVVDATDNAPSRYLISDMCVLLDKPLVSGSCLRWEGQLTTYHYTNRNGIVGPCYRCLYPNPPIPECVTNCSDGGIIGAVPGVIGSMQALEVFKVLIGSEPSFSQKLFIFDGLRGMSRIVKLRPQQSSCVCCGSNASITMKNLPNYSEFCRMDAGDKCQVLHILKPEERISVKEYSKICQESSEHVLIDVRNEVELGICALPNSINVPLSRLQAQELMTNKVLKGLDKLESVINNYTEFVERNSSVLPVYVVCRMGNDSQRAVMILKKLYSGTSLQFKDIKGGLMAWAKLIDPTMPQY